MKFSPDIHHRQSIRLKGYDYSSGGVYFVTMCTQDRAMLFGNIVETVGADLVSALSARMILNDAGRMIETVYHETLDSFSGIYSEKHIIMPNHIHCIITIDRADTEPRAGANTRADIEPRAGANTRADTEPRAGANTRADTRSAPTKAALPSMIQVFKSKTTVRYIAGVNAGIYPTFNRRVWQRNYYEHIIRNEKEYQKICEYIDENPARWTEDKYYG